MRNESNIANRCSLMGVQQNCRVVRCLRTCPCHMPPVMKALICEVAEQTRLSAIT
jgi:hypothetical protein